MRSQMNSKLLTLTTTVLASIAGAYAPDAQAYLDPSTGSMVVSAIVGIFASIALALKTYWYRIKAFFRRGDKQGSDSDSGSGS